MLFIRIIGVLMAETWRRVWGDGKNFADQDF